LQICFFRKVTTCHRQFAKSDTFGDVSKLQDAININARWSDTFGMSLASH
jgi:hypothetical protein